ncbi:hypothetical protein lpp2057 [Legionella pneumophila str. Paris]|nr:hypothetical protein lpp2057 [Legionella pneumophila str. Paris]
MPTDPRYWYCFSVNRELVVFAKIFPFPSPQPSPAQGIIMLLKLLAQEKEQIGVKLNNPCSIQDSILSKKLQGLCLYKSIILFV